MRISKPSPEMLERKQQEAERQKARNALVRRLSTARPSQADINELVLMLAREHGLIE